MNGDDDADFDVLPVIEFKDEILQSMEKNQIVICIGETGSGKTTQIPQFFLEHDYLSRGKMVAITQPRRVAAMTVAQRVSDERGGRLGDEIGYTVRFDDNSSSRTKVKYMTDGILVRECIMDRSLSKYQVIMLDEAHERSIHTDILFGLVKEACKLRDDLKVIVTSATLDFVNFSSYFNNCPTIRIPGRIFPVDIYHSKTKQVMTASGPSNNSYIQSAVDVVMKIHKKDEEGHILVFLTGQDEIDKACGLIRNTVREDGLDTKRDLVVFPLYAALSSDQQRQVFKKLSDPGKGKDASRKCIVATNIAETSVTVPGVRFVVDAGFVKQKTFDPVKKLESLVVVPISQVASQQRAGRAGRTAPGQCYRLYSSECFDDMMHETVPEILRSNLANTVLYLKVLGIIDVMGFDFIEPPDKYQVAEALTELHLLGAIDDRGNVTERGRNMSQFPVEPNVARMLVEAGKSEVRCIEEMAIIAAMLSAENVFVQPAKEAAAANEEMRHRNREKNQRAQNAKNLLEHPDGDHFTYLKLFRLFEESKYARHSKDPYDHHNIRTKIYRPGNHERDSDAEIRAQKQFCEEHFLRFRALRSAVKIRDQLLQDAEKVGLKFTKRRDRDEPVYTFTTRRMEFISRAVAAGLFANAARLCANEKVYRSMPLAVVSLNDPITDSNTPSVGSNNHRSQPPDKLVAGAEIMLIHLHQSSALTSVSRLPEYVVYQELVLGGRVTMRHVGRMSPYILRDFRTAWHPIHPLALTGRTASLQHADGKTERSETASSTRNDVDPAAGSEKHGNGAKGYMNENGKRSRDEERQRISGREKDGDRKRPKDDGIEEVRNERRVDSGEIANETKLDTVVSTMSSQASTVHRKADSSQPKSTPKEVGDARARYLARKSGR
jgi:ATP-dependent RNA helicase DHX8/PRP22